MSQRFQEMESSGFRAPLGFIEYQFKLDPEILSLPLSFWEKDLSSMILCKFLKLSIRVLSK